MPYQNTPHARNSDDQFLSRNGELAHTVAVLFRRLDAADYSAAVAVLGDLHAVLRDAGLNFTHLANAIDELPFARMANRWDALVAFCHVRRDAMRANERSLIDTLQEWNGEPTQRQREWLTTIARRLYFLELAAT
jgi:hypothetical protein